MVVIYTLVDIISLEPFYPPYDADGGEGGGLINKHQIYGSFVDNHPGKVYLISVIIVKVNQDRRLIRVGEA